MEALNNLSDISVQWDLTIARINEWMANDVFGLRWWFMVMLFLLTSITWWKTVDKLRLTEITIYVTIVIIIILILDEVGMELTLWHYPVDVIPIFPPLTAINIACLPLVYSLIYQLFRSWKKFILVLTVTTIIFCFVLEPLFVWGGMYNMLKWKSYYGLPLYIAIPVIGKALVHKIYSIANAQ